MRHAKQTQQSLQQAAAAVDSGESLQDIALALQRLQLAQQQQEGVDIRGLLWTLLCQVKPGACPWYQLAAQQQQQAGKGGTAGAPASVPASTGRRLWSTLTASLAADLLLVPPSIRDMVGNNWAAGAGRLAAPGTDSTSSSSSNSGTAARMLAVQYARAARRQFAQVRLELLPWSLLLA
jgi:hypothetical protein